MELDSRKVGIMMYIKRDAEEAINKLVSMFKVVLITGPRQVGKSTILKVLYAYLPEKKWL